MATAPAFTTTPIIGAATLLIGDSSRVAPVAPQTIFAPGANGGMLERINVVALAGVAAGTVVRLFRTVAGVHHFLQEVQIAAIAPAKGIAAQQFTLQAADYPNLFPIAVPPNVTITATIGDAQVVSEASVNSIALTQTLGAAGNLVINGALAVAASASAISTSATTGAAALLTLTTSPYVMTTPAQVTLTSAGNDSGVNFTIRGRLTSGVIATETIAGPNANTVFSANVYASVFSIMTSGAAASAVSAGYSTVAPLVASTQGIAAPITLTSVGNLSAINFTITGTTSQGLVQTEVLAGPNVNTVVSVNSYATVTTITANAAVGTAVLVGNNPVLGGIKVQGEGGGF